MTFTRIGDGAELGFRHAFGDMIGGTAGLGERTGIRLGLVNSAPHCLCSLPSPRFLFLSELHEFLVPPGDPGHLDLRHENVPTSGLLPWLPAKHLPTLLSTRSVPSETPTPTQINNLYFQIICVFHPEHSFKVSTL